MRITFAVATLFAAIALYGQTVPGTGAISGRVANAVTGDGVPSVKLVIACMIADSHESACGEHRTETSPDGTYRLEDLPAGSYLLVAYDAPGFLNPSPQPTAKIRSGQENTEANILLNPAATIMGKVIDSEAKPLATENVAVFKKSSRMGHISLQVVMTATTDSRGEYRMGSLRAGDYYVGVTRIKGGLHFFSPGVINLEQASLIHVDVGQHYGGADIRVPLIALHNLRGKITQEGAGSLSGSRAVLFDGLDRRSAEVAQDGRFAFTDLPSGDYTLFVQNKAAAENGAFKTHIVAQEQISIGNSDVNDAALIVRPPATVTGQITLDQGQAAELRGTKIDLRPDDLIMFSDLKQCKVGSDGSFRIANLEPARYRIQVTAPAGTYVDGAEYNSQQLTTALIDFSSGISGRLTIHLRRGTSAITGSLKNANGEAAVLLIPSDWKPGNWREMLLKTTEKGQFAFANVAPGSYLLVAASGDNQQFQDPDFIQFLASRAQPVELAHGDGKSIDVSVVSAAVP